MIKKLLNVVVMSMCFLSFWAYAADKAIVSTTSVVDDVSETIKPLEPLSNQSKKKDYMVTSVKDYFLTVCTQSQAQTAMAWQTVCRSGRDFDRMCTVLSYQRYCEPATAEEIKGLKPLKPNYRNVFLKE